MKNKYCYKCDLYYWTSRGNKELKACPFCSLGRVEYDNLAVKDKMFIKESQDKWLKNV